MSGERLGRGIGRLLTIDATVVRFLRETLLRHRFSLAVAFAGSLLSAGFEGATLGIFAIALHTLAAEAGASFAAEYGMVGGWADAGLEAFGRGALFLLLVALAVLSQLLRSGLRFGSDWTTARVQAAVEADVRKRIFRLFMEMSYGCIRAFKVGDLASYMNQVAYLGHTLYRFSVILGHVLLLVTYLVVLVWLSWLGTLLAIAAMILASLSLRWFVRRIRTAARAYTSHTVELSERTFELLSGSRLLRSFAREKYAIRTVDAVIDRVAAARRWAVSWQAGLSPVVDSFAVVGVGVLLAGGYFVLGQEDLGALTRFATFLFVLYRLTPRLSAINKVWGMIQHYLPFVERISEFLEVEDKELAPVGGEGFAGLERSIELAEVSLKYPDRESWAVEDVSLEVHKGEMVALVGESGSGKSSIADLLVRLYEPSRGRVLVDGRDLADLDWVDWRNRIGVVSQDTFLLNDSIEENIAFGRAGTSRADVERAARAAHANGFIEALPESYETVIGDEGHRLSGGERQRLAIARALLAQPDLLILDEATSDLDSRSERLIQKSLSELRSGRAVLAIAHRLSTIAMADRILVMSGGRVVEAGTHGDLLALAGAYARLWNLLSSDPDRP